MTTVAPYRRVIGVVALAAGTALALTGCGSGQISQMSTQVAAVNGTPADKGWIDLRNVHILPADPSDPMSNKRGGEAVLSFIAINTSEEDPDKLLDISSVLYNGKEIGEVEITPANVKDLPPQTRIYAVSSAEAEQIEKDGLPPEIERDLKVALVKITDLKEDIIPGLTVEATFSFEKAGDIKVAVPIDARDTDRGEPILVKVVEEQVDIPQPGEDESAHEGTGDESHGGHSEGDGHN